MGTLDYQNPREARSQGRRELWSRLFGVTQEEAWETLAREINGRVEQGALGDDRVVAQAGCWQIVLDCTSRASTRLRAPYINRDGFRFRIYRASAFDKLGRGAGLQDVEIGDLPFDERYIIQSNNPAKVKLFLQDARLRQLIAACPHVMFEVKDQADDLFTHRFPQGVDELFFLAAGTITDIDRLRRMFDLFTETLGRLHEIGSAADYPPGVVL